MRCCVTGSTGQLGFDVCDILSERKHIVIPMTRKQADLRNPSDVKSYILYQKPDVVIHCGAYTAVDKAEDEPQLCHLVNALSTKAIAEAVLDCNGKMLFVSTDYVFNGSGDAPWLSTDKTNPLNAYGISKSDGERYCTEVLNRLFILRTSWLFGKSGNNFVKTIIRKGKEAGNLRVIADQTGSPTYSRDLALLICDMINTEKYGVYHATNRGYCSWYEFALEILRQTGVACEISPISTDEYPVKAVRPKNSRLDTSCLTENGFEQLPVWQDALKRML